MIRRPAERIRQFTHGSRIAVEHHLDGIFHQRLLQRRLLVDQLVVAIPVALPIRLSPVHRLEDDLPRLVPIEDHRRVFPDMTRNLQHLTCDVPVQQAAGQRRAVGCAFDRAAADDQRD
jgi:hypothetical protein